MQTVPTIIPRHGHAARARQWHHEADLLADSAFEEGLTEGQRTGLMRLAGDAERRAQRERFRASIASAAKPATLHFAQIGHLQAQTLHWCVKSQSNNNIK